jgi:hypothetical protein
MGGARVEVASRKKNERKRRAEDAQNRCADVVTGARRRRRRRRIFSYSPGVPTFHIPTDPAAAPSPGSPPRRRARRVGRAPAPDPDPRLRAEQTGGGASDSQATFAFDLPSSLRGGAGGGFDLRGGSSPETQPTQMGASLRAPDVPRGGSTRDGGGGGGEGGGVGTEGDEWDGVRVGGEDGEEGETQLCEKNEASLVRALGRRAPTSSQVTAAAEGAVGSTGAGAGVDPYRRAAGIVAAARASSSCIQTGHPRV